MRKPYHKWDEQSHWRLMLPPGRPSALHLNFFRSHIAKLPKSASIAVLGSTPELRDLCVENGHRRVHVLDRSVRFHEVVNSLLIYKNPKETVHFGDWLELLHAMPRTFDAILSDLTLGSIEYERRNAFFTALEDALRTGGIFLDKVLTHSARLLPLAKLDAKYRLTPFNLSTSNDFANEYFFLSELVSSGIVDIARSRAFLSRRYLQEPRLQRLLEEAITLVTERGIWYYGRPWKIVRLSYGGQLRLVERHNELRPSVFAGHLRLYAFVKSERNAGVCL